MLCSTYFYFYKISLDHYSLLITLYSIYLLFITSYYYLLLLLTNILQITNYNYVHMY